MYKDRGLIKIKIFKKFPAEIYERCKNSKNIVHVHISNSFKDPLAWNSKFCSFHFPLSFFNSIFMPLKAKKMPAPSQSMLHYNIGSKNMWICKNFCAKMSFFVILFSRMDIINMSFLIYYFLLYGFCSFLEFSLLADGIYE